MFGCAKLYGIGRNYLWSEKLGNKVIGDLSWLKIRMWTNLNSFLNFLRFASEDKTFLKKLDTNEISVPNTQIYTVLNDMESIKQIIQGKGSKNRKYSYILRTNMFN